MVGIFRNTNDKEANFCFVQRTKRNPKGRSLENETAKEKAKVYLIDECCLRLNFNGNRKKMCNMNYKYFIKLPISLSKLYIFLA